MLTNAALASALQRPLSALALDLQQPLSLVSPCSHHTVTLVTDPAITTLAAINPFRYVTIPTTKYNGGVLWMRGLSILQLVVLEGRWDTVMQCVW